MLTLVVDGYTCVCVGVNCRKVVYRAAALDRSPVLIARPPARHPFDTSLRLRAPIISFFGTRGSLCTLDSPFAFLYFDAVSRDARVYLRTRSGNRWCSLNFNEVSARCEPNCLLVSGQFDFVETLKKIRWKNDFGVKWCAWVIMIFKYIWRTLLNLISLNFLTKTAYINRYMTYCLLYNFKYLFN